MIWRPKIKIKTKIFTGFLLVTTVSVFSVSYFIFRRAEEAFKEQVLNDITLVAETKEAGILGFLERLKGRAADFSSDGLIRDLTVEVSAGKDGSSRDFLAEHLIKNKMPLDEFLLGIDVLDLNGRIIASTHKEEIGFDESGEDYFVKAKELDYGRARVSGALIPHHFDGKIAVAVSAPLTDKESGKQIGVIANFIDVKNFSEIMTGEHQIRLGAISGILGRMKTFEMYLADADGLAFTELKFLPGAVLKQKLDILPVRKCREEKKEIAALYGNYLDVPVIGASMCLPNGWTLVVEMGEEEALARIQSIKQSVFLIGLAIILAFGAVAYRLASGITGPITALARTAERIKTGDFSQKAEVASEDEIGRLAASFNEMVDKIKKRAEESEKLTAVMVGRELRMVELKKEMEELKKKTGTAG